MKSLQPKCIFTMCVLIFMFFLVSGCSDSTSDDTGTTADTATGDTGNPDGGSGDTGSNESVTHKSGESITSSQKWSGTHILEGNLYIKSGVEISPCTKVLVAPGAKISVTDSGSIKSIGTKDCPVVFTSSKSSKAKGDWNLIEIYDKSSSDNAFDYTILEYGGSGSYGMLWIDGGASVKIDNTTFDNSKSYGLYVDQDANIGSFTGNKFSNMDLNPIFISANEVRFLNKIETEGNAVNAVLVNGGNISKAAVWKNIGIPYFIKQHIYIKASVEIEAGNTFLMGNDTKIGISDSGSIKAIGTQDKPIVFTSSKATKDAGDWRLIEIYSTASADNTFEYVTLEFGGNGDYGLLWIDEGADVIIKNTTFKESASYGIYAETGVVISSFSGNKFENIILNPISITAPDIIQLDKFETSGNQVNTILVRGGTTLKKGIWKNTGIPYEMMQNIYIKSAIEVDAGVTILIGPNYKIGVSDSGSLRLKGTKDANITVKSAKSTPAAGDWGEIDIYSTANNDNVWDYVNVMHGGGDDYGQVWVDDGITLTLNNCKFSESKGCDVYVEDGANVVNNSSTYKVCPK